MVSVYTACMRVCTACICVCAWVCVCVRVCAWVCVCVRRVCVGVRVCMCTHVSLCTVMIIFTNAQSGGVWRHSVDRPIYSRFTLHFQTKRR